MISTREAVLVLEAGRLLRATTNVRVWVLVGGIKSSTSAVVRSIVNATSDAAMHQASGFVLHHGQWTVSYKESSNDASGKRIHSRQRVLCGRS